MIRKILKKCRIGPTEAIDGPSFDRQTVVSGRRWAAQDFGEESGKPDNCGTTEETTVRRLIDRP